MISSPVQVVDLFAGPGGLGEGFSSYTDENGFSFKIKVSAEMTGAARSTLRLRAFYRALKQEQPRLLDEYYRLVEGGDLADLSVVAKELWDEAGREALQIELGTAEGNERLDAALASLSAGRHWVLIGGPPCQAYSLAGRSRNRGNPGYKAEDDPRHFLYREYLRIIQQRRPSVFVMENVKGILSSTVNGERIFPKILKDLAEPDRAVGQPDSGLRYRIYSLVTDEVFESGTPDEAINPSNYIIRAEEYGIPQSRHRVILLGVSNDLALETLEHKLVRRPGPSVSQTIGGLPQLRSRITKCPDSGEVWSRTVRQHMKELSAHCGALEGAHTMKTFLEHYSDQAGLGRLDVGGVRVPKGGDRGATGTHLDSWLLDDRLSCWLNHEARGHMSSDLRRYAYAAVFAEVMKRSPKGSADFSLPGLEPDHRSWKSGSFSDRFRVQLRDEPSTTITSHIAKDGHYFIHYDAKQCRSLTVREAARLQTFPDNYFFLGTRTEQYHQVGNAVPPLLAHQIAEVVAKILHPGRTDKQDVSRRQTGEYVIQES